MTGKWFLFLNEMFCFLMSVCSNYFVYVLLKERHTSECMSSCNRPECMLLTMYSLHLCYPQLSQSGGDGRSHVMISCYWHGRFTLSSISCVSPHMKRHIDSFGLVSRKLLDEAMSLQLTIDGDICDEVIPFYCCIDLILLAVLSMLLVLLVP